MIGGELSEGDKMHMRRKMGMFFGLLSLLVLVLAAYFVVAIWKNAKAKDRPPVEMSVTGEGKISVTPDVATLNATVMTENTRVKDAQQQNTDKSNMVITFLKDKGIEDKDIKTTSYNIYPQQEYYTPPPCYTGTCPTTRPPRISGYQVRHTIEIKIRNLDIADDIVEGVVSAGANEVGSLAFKLDDEKGAQAEARKKAIADAKNKAQVLARDLGVRLGDIVGFSESGGPYPIYARTAFADGKGEAAAPPTPQVAPGEQEIVSTVTVTYEFK